MNIEFEPLSIMILDNCIDPTKVYAFILQSQLSNSPSSFKDWFELFKLFTEEHKLHIEVVPDSPPVLLLSPKPINPLALTEAIIH